MCDMDEYDFVSGHTVVTKKAPQYCRVIRWSSAYSRLMRAGFKIEDGMVMFDQQCIPVAVFNFVCTCGTREMITIRSGVRDRIKEIDVAYFIEHVGAVSAKHLRDDGYSIDEIKRIRSAYV